MKGSASENTEQCKKLIRKRRTRTMEKQRQKLLKMRIRRKEIETQRDKMRDEKVGKRDRMWANESEKMSISRMEIKSNDPTFSI